MYALYFYLGLSFSLNAVASENVYIDAPETLVSGVSQKSKIKQGLDHDGNKTRNLTFKIAPFGFNLTIADVNVVETTYSDTTQITQVNISGALINGSFTFKIDPAGKKIYDTSLLSSSIPLPFADEALKIGHTAMSGYQTCKKFFNW